MRISTEQLQITQASSQRQALSAFHLHQSTPAASITSAPGKRALASRTRIDTTALTRASTITRHNSTTTHRPTNSPQSRFQETAKSTNKPTQPTRRTIYSAPAAMSKKEETSTSFFCFSEIVQTNCFRIVAATSETGESTQTKQKSRDSQSEEPRRTAKAQLCLPTSS